MTTFQQQKPTTPTHAIVVPEPAKSSVSQVRVCFVCHMHVPRGRFTEEVVRGELRYFCGPRSHPKHRGEETCYNIWQVRKANDDALALIQLFGDFGFFNQQTVEHYKTRIKDMKSFHAMEILVNELVRTLKNIYETSRATLEVARNKLGKPFQRLLEILGLFHQKDDLEDMGFAF